MLKGWTTGRLLALIRRFTGNLASLTTSSKADLVSAINSLNPQFSATPVYDVTLAEAASNQTILLTEHYQNLWCYFWTTGDSNLASNTSAIVKVTIGETVYPLQIDNFVATGNNRRAAYAEITNEMGKIKIRGGQDRNSNLADVMTIAAFADIPLFGNDYVSKIEIVPANGAILNVNSRFVVYAAKEAE